jgi:hypothetical protein
LIVEAEANVEAIGKAEEKETIVCNATKNYQL